MIYVTYKDLVARYGQRPAVNTLYLLEKLTKIQHEIISIDMDHRFDKALKALSDIDFSDTDVVANSQKQ